MLLFIPHSIYQSHNLSHFQPTSLSKCQAWLDCAFTCALRGINVDIANKNGLPPLYVAAQDSCELIERLLFECVGNV
jgi:hypothetical protein